LYNSIGHSSIISFQLSDRRQLMASTLHHYADKGRGFFVEVGVDYAQEQPVVLRSFVSSVPLEVIATT
jgi:hypothetical protein